MWCHRQRPSWVLPSTRLSLADRQRLEAAFLALLYDEFQETKDTDGVVEEDNPDHPEQSHWRWILRGTRERCWLEIHDDRIAELIGRPYYLDPVGDPSFFDWAWRPDSTDDMTRPEGLHAFFVSIGTWMDENLMGQAEAIHAYQAGATPDNPPWIHTTFL